MNQRGFTVLSVLVGTVLVLALVGGGYYLGKSNQAKTNYQSERQQQTPLESNTTQVGATVTPMNVPTPAPSSNPTANWKAYSNKKYGYAAKYPSNLTVNEFETSYSQNTEFTLGRDPAGNAYFANYTVTVAKETFKAQDAASVNFLTADWTNNFYAMKVGESKTAATVTFTKLPSEKIAGQEAVVLKVSAVGSSDQKRYLLKHNGFVYMIYDYDNPADYPLFLSTFEFLN